MNVYDFDETIYDGESSIEFILAYLKKDPTIVRFLPSIAKLRMRILPKPMRRNCRRILPKTK